jgi:hypothetical protein
VKDVATTLLALSASLPPGCKYALLGTSELRVRAEQPEPAEPESAGRMADLETGFAVAAGQLGGAVAVRPGGTGDSTDVPVPDIATLCLESGWHFEQRSDGSLVIDLDVSGFYVSAVVEARVSGIAVEACIVPRLLDADVRRTAVATLLLRANAAFRMVRAVFRSVAEQSQALLEAPLPADASAAELSRALGAVAVAARHCSAEAQMLAADERLASAYMSHCGEDDHSVPVPIDISLAQTWA